MLSICVENFELKILSEFKINKKMLSICVEKLNVENFECLVCEKTALEGWMGE